MPEEGVISEAIAKLSLKRLMVFQQARFFVIIILI
jgi:hypothetical protein